MKTFTAIVFTLLLPASALAQPSLSDLRQQQRTYEHQAFTQQQLFEMQQQSATQQNMLLEMQMQRNNQQMQLPEITVKPPKSFTGFVDGFEERE